MGMRGRTVVSPWLIPVATTVGHPTSGAAGAAGGRLTSGVGGAGGRPTSGAAAAAGGHLATAGGHLTSGAAAAAGGHLTSGVGGAGRYYEAVPSDTDL